ncbi:sugar ABC transporter substrate-binding protein [cyanobiont of Ornithocercus magnificus]|nr:sugar ABC transporter substrate-binding protein [cyanobiont of Ornithocercus magnificus]
MVGSIRAKDIVHISVLMPAPFANSTAELVRKFNREHRGHTVVDVTRGPLDTEAVADLAISSLLLGNSPFDILLIDVTWLPKFAAAGWLQPLDNWFDADDVDSLATGARVGNEWEGQLLRWPLVADMGLLYWRTDLMEKPPATPEELIAVGRKLQQEGKVTHGYVLQGRQYEGLSCVFLEVLEGFGGSWFQSRETVGLDSLASKDAAAWLRSLIVTGVSPQAITNFGESEVLQVFRNGDAAMMRNWPYAWASLQDEESPVKGKVGITTMVARPGQPSTATQGSWGLAMLNSTKHADQAAELIRYLTSVSSQRELFLDHGYTPTSQVVFNDPELLRQSPILSILNVALSRAQLRPTTALYAQVSDVLQRRLSSILTGQQDPDIAMEQVERNSMTILRSAGGRT